MKTKERKVSVRDLVDEWDDRGVDGVFGMRGRLDVRPPFQREFVYNDKKQEAVIQTLKQGFPLNVMYWHKRGRKFEVIDGQQRTVSIANYVNNGFSQGGFYYKELSEREQERILDYELDVFVCDGSPEECLKWYITINTAGMLQTDQELRNAVYHGPFVHAAKKFFSRKGCPASTLMRDWSNGNPLRQELLETALDWMSAGDIEGYMGRHRNDADAEDLIGHAKAVLSWAKMNFPEPREHFKKVNWGLMHRLKKTLTLDPAELSEQMDKLEADPDVTRHAGIVPYLLTGEVKELSIRSFNAAHKRRAWNRQGKKCASGGCKTNNVLLADCEAHHKVPWVEGGRTVDENCMVVCRPCHHRITNA